MLGTNIKVVHYIGRSGRRWKKRRRKALNERRQTESEETKGERKRKVRKYIEGIEDGI